MYNYNSEDIDPGQERLNDFMDTSRELAEQFADDPIIAAERARFQAGLKAAHERLMKEDPVYRARCEENEAIQAEINVRYAADLSENLN